MKHLFTLATSLALTAPAVAQCTGAGTNFNNAVTGPVKAIAPWATAPGAPQRLVIGGDFVASSTNPSALPCDYIGYWDGSSWHAFGWGADAPVNAITTWDPDGPGPLPQQVIAAGAFTHVGADSTGPIQANHIARWDGAAWNALGPGLDADVHALTVWDPDGPGPLNELLIVAGEFTHAGPAEVDYIAAWDGTAWRSLGWGFDAPVNALTTWDPDATGPQHTVLLAGGEFTATGSDATGEIVAQRAAFWNGDSWTPLNASVPDWSRTIDSLKVYDFDGPGPQTPAPVALASTANVWRWSGASWEYVDLYPQPNNWKLCDSIAVMNNPDGRSYLWAAGDEWTWYEDWSSDLCHEGCFYWQLVSQSLWPLNGTDLVPGTESLNAECIETWDSDGNGPLAPQLVAAGPFPGFLRSIAFQPAPYITHAPEPQSARMGETRSFTLSAQSQGALSYLWHKKNRFGVWDLANDGLQASGSTITGSRTATITIQNIAAGDAAMTSPSNGDFYADLRCFVSNSCGSVVADVRLHITPCSADFNFDGDSGTDADIEAFFACLAGSCCPSCPSADFNADGDTGTDADIEAFFRVLAGGTC